MNPTIKRTFDTLVIAIFCAAITIPAIYMLTTAPQSQSEFEGRTLTDSISTDGQTFGSILNQVESYVDDQFVLREELITVNNDINFQLLGTSSTDKVVVGKEGWLFLGEGILESLGQEPVSEQTLRSWQLNVELRRNALAEHDIKYVLVIIPDKHTVYPEYLPQEYSGSVGPSQLDQFIEHMSQHSDVPILDLRETILSAKETTDAPLYYKTDTHWTDTGAFIATKAILGYLRPMFPDINIPELHSEHVGDLQRSGDLARLVEGNNSSSETAIDLKPIPNCVEEPDLSVGSIAENICPELEFDAFVIYDSFFDMMAQFITQSLGRSMYAPWYIHIKEERITDYQPEIVIEAFVERSIGYIGNSYTRDIEYNQLEHGVEIKNVNSPNATLATDNEAFTLTSNVDTPYLEFDVNPIAPQSIIGVHLEIGTPNDEPLIVYFGNADEPFAIERSVVRENLSTDDVNDIYMIYQTDISVDRIRISFGNGNGRYVIEELEISTNNPN